MVEGSGSHGYLENYFTGVSQACCWEECCAASATAPGGTGPGGTGGVGVDKPVGKDQPQPSPTPPTQRRLAKSFSVTPSAVTKGIKQHLAIFHYSPVKFS